MSRRDPAAGHRPARSAIGRLLTGGLALAAGALGLASMLGTAIAPASAQATTTVEAAEAARLPVKVAVLVASRRDLCYDQGFVGAITKFVTLEQARINKAGGVGGRRLDVEFLDDANEAERTVANLGKALIDPATLAVVGLVNSQNATAAFKELGQSIDRTGMPFISDVSLTSIFAKHPTVFSTRPSLEEDRLAVAVQFIKDTGFRRVAFVGFKDREFSTKFADGLKGALPADRMPGDIRLSWKDAAQPLDPTELAGVAPALQAAKPDLVVLAVGTQRTADMLSLMKSADVGAPVLMFGRLEELPADSVAAYPGDLYQLAVDGLPDVYNDRMRRDLAGERPEAWLFEGAKVPQAPGWANGTCKDRPIVEDRDPLEPANARAIALGTQYADMLRLVAASAVAEGVRVDVPAMRAAVVRRLSTAYATGRGAFKGSFETWSFDRFTRAATRTPVVLIRPRSLGRTQIAPVQYTRLKNGALRRMPTLYADVDLIRIFNVDDAGKTFYAEFYLSMRAGEGADVGDVEFVNAYLDPRTNGREITVTPLHEGGPSGAYPDSMKVYKVSGRFLFEPDLSNYPFDFQRFAITIQPRKADAPFIVQPPPDQLRDKTVATDGWNVLAQYVGYEGQFVPVIDAFSHEPSVVPFSAASYVWQMNRVTTDYYLRVVVPLGFILIVAYLSIFIPQSHFEAIVTIQVTALLSAVALYLSQPQLGSDAATVSDRIFVFIYMMVSVMIVISILRVNRFVAAQRWLKLGLAVVHVAALPALVLAMAWYVHRLSAVPV